jgi:hypothetical protein
MGEGYTEPMSPIMVKEGKTPTFWGKISAAGGKVTVTPFQS